MECLVPAPLGAHSSVGRSSNRGMDKKRAIAVELAEQSKKALEARKEAAERIAAERAQGVTGGGVKPAPKAAAPSAAADPSAVQETAVAVPKKKNTGGKYPVSDDKTTSTPMGRAVRERIQSLNPVAQDIKDIGLKDPQSPAGLGLLPETEGADELGSPAKKDEKASPAFTAQGVGAQVFDQAAAALHKRFILKSARAVSNPEIGHYRVNDTLTQGRIKVMDFGYRPKHETRSHLKQDLRDDSRELGPEDLTVLELHKSKSGSMFAHPSIYSTATPRSLSMSDLERSTSRSLGQSLMSTSAHRPDLNNIPGSRMGLTARIQSTDMSAPGNPEDQDRMTSSVRRSPEVNLMKQKGRGNFFDISGCQFFEVGKYVNEAGKYAVKDDVVTTKAKTHIGFHQQMNRSNNCSRYVPPAALDNSSKGTGNMIDRSAYRTAVIARPRTTHVMEMHKDLNRPPLITTAKPHHDESDPEISRMVHERAMAHNADTLHKATKGRPDRLVMHMGKSLSRDGAGHGARIAQGNISKRAKNGCPWYETHGSINSSVEQLKDTLRSRSDRGLMAFEQSKGRGQTRDKGEYSALHRPRDHAAPDFSRIPPHNGFDSRTQVARSLKVHPRSRTHDAMPGWSADIVDDLMSSDVDGV